MVKHHRIYVLQLRKGDPEQCFKDSHDHLPPVMYYYDSGTRKPKPNIRRLLFLFSFASLAFLILSRLLFCSSPTSPCPLLYSFGIEEGSQMLKNRGVPCSSRANDTICCDRTAFRTDICFMRGDIRSHASSNSFLLLANARTNFSVEEKIRPYTRKWETNVMSTIDELTLRTIHLNESDHHHCDVHHDVPAVVFSTGGYTGNVYHEFNDGIIPLYITSHHFNKKVMFVILEYHDWWVTKYGDVVSRLSAYTPIEFSSDRRTHCFPEVVVGLRIHDELTVNASRMANNKTIRDFRKMLDEAYRGRIRYIERVEERRRLSPKQSIATNTNQPSLVIVSRRGSRSIENEEDLVALAEKVGFHVRVLRPDRTTELCKIYRALNYSDAMIGVHGAAMTHFLFMRPGKVFIQVVPLGTDWAAETYYGKPAAKMGLWYVGYKILPRESSLYREYPKEDPILVDPESVAKKGWEVTKKVYLDRQNVRLDLARFEKRLVRAHRYLVSRRKRPKWQKM
ncbi:xylan glycosyltransferase MUCI21-like [Typha latifolia]|uniref:xylan glycosyltransferase MUCI21-like n=1 Tax=Typha latifolia TaxID=4733 RepID=UPI003C2EA833